ncbi:CRISPR-associated endoribonuclease Cas6 [Rapidithrix thailandica]|uniref:CRISPR-associated endoribonuclease Cas6 n=1 Tax=Rapidithrix thailandica TaxID=413964 RepID=A0AAW9RYH1_9BACT
MRFTLTFEISAGDLLPLNYQYEMSSWIYKVLHQADTEFAKFLHSKGYTLGANKSFRLFTFSNLHLPRNQWKIIGDRIKLFCREISCTISFFIDEGAEKFIQGLFQNQIFQLGDQITRVKMQVKQIEAKPVRVMRNTLRLRTKSPLVVARKEERSNGRSIAKYLSPNDEKYSHYFFKNLLEKYAAALGGDNNAHPLREEDLQFKLLSTTPKRKAIVIKAHTQAATKVIGYQFDFELTAPVELLEFGLQAGFGTGNSQGFGCCEGVTKDK